VLGQKLDYLILRIFAHCRNIATEEELNSKYEHFSPTDMDTGKLRLLTYRQIFEGHFPIDSDLYYLDIGCGTGELTLSLANEGCKHITAIDFVPRHIARGSASVKQLQIEKFVEFICDDVYNWTPPQKYDVVMCFDTFEHVQNPKKLLEKLNSLVSPDGTIVVSFGPLFHSPFGDHMGGFFRVQIPWRGVLFSEKAIMRLRSESYRPTDPATRYQDIVGGLNLMRFSDFLGYVGDSDLEFDFFKIDTPWGKNKTLHNLSRLLIRIPIVRDYFVSNVHATLRLRCQS
jgi:SAM-dependent methyltransferase